MMLAVPISNRLWMVGGGYNWVNTPLGNGNPIMGESTQLLMYVRFEQWLLDFVDASLEFPTYNANDFSIP